MTSLPSCCAACGIRYYWDMLCVDEYINCWSSYGLGESMAIQNYTKILNKKMPEPCKYCDEEYVTFRATLSKAYVRWYNRYNRDLNGDDDYDPDW